MKNKTILSVILAIVLVLQSNAQIQVYSNGSSTLLGSFWTGGIRTGIVSFSGTNMPCIYPAFGWYGTLGTQANYFGAAYIDHIYANCYNTFPSDLRLKKNIVKIDSAIYKLKLLNPVKYDIIDSKYDSVSGNAKKFLIADSKNRLGFVAQEMQTIFPQCVHKEPTSGYYGISTMDLIPVLVAAFKEQQNIIDSLKNDINKLKSGKGNLKSASFETEVENTENLEFGWLGQNSPNPWSQTTNISYWLNENQKGTINIFDVNGVHLKKIPISVGNGSVTVKGNELRPGIYVYNLQLVNGHTVATKTMVLTQ